MVPRRPSVLDRAVASGHNPHRRRGADCPSCIRIRTPSRDGVDTREPRGGAARSAVAAGARRLRRHAEPRAAAVHGPAARAGRRARPDVQVVSRPDVHEPVADAHASSRSSGARRPTCCDRSAIRRRFVPRTRRRSGRRSARSLRCLPDLLRLGELDASGRGHCSGSTSSTSRDSSRDLRGRIRARCPIARSGTRSPTGSRTRRTAHPDRVRDERRAVARNGLRKACRRRRLSVRTSRLSAARRRPAFGQHAAGDRPRRAGGRRRQDAGGRGYLLGRTTATFGDFRDALAGTHVPGVVRSIPRHRTATAAATSRTGRCRACTRSRAGAVRDSQASCRRPNASRASRRGRTRRPPRPGASSRRGSPGGSADAAAAGAHDACAS